MNNATRQLVVPLRPSVPLERRAQRIRNLMTDMVRNALGIGEELSNAYETFPLGPKKTRMGWKTWLKTIGLSNSYAISLIQVYRKFGYLNADGVQVPAIKVLRLLVREVTPESARQEVLDRVKGGERIGEPKAKNIVQKHLPSPKKANEIARETGKPTAASDGYVYLGATAEQARESVERRTLVYSAKEAIKTLAEISITAEEFLEYAAPHQLWKAREEQQIDDALEWLRALHKAWPEKRNQIR